MVWPFSGFWSRSTPAPKEPPKEAPPARKTPVSAAADAALIAAWEDRTVRELRDTLEEVGWDSESLDRLLARVGAPEEAAAPKAAAAPRGTPASGAKAKRARSPDEDEDEDEDEEDDEEDEEFDISPRYAGRKQAKQARSPPTPRATATPQASPSPRSPGRRKSDTGAKSPPRPAVNVTAEVAAMSPAQLKSEFQRYFGYAPASGNMDWLRRKVDALKKGTDLNVGGTRGRPPTHTLPEGASP